MVFLLIDLMNQSYTQQPPLLYNKSFNEYQSSIKIKAQ